MSKKNFKWWVALPATVATLPLIAASCVKAKIDTNPSPSPQPDPSKPGPMNPSPEVPKNPMVTPPNNNMPQTPPSMMPRDMYNPQEIINKYSNKFAGLDEIKKQIDELHNLFDFGDNSQTDLNTDKYKWLIRDFNLINTIQDNTKIAEKLKEHLEENPDVIITEFSVRIEDLILNTLEDDIKNNFKRRYMKLNESYIKSYKTLSENYLKIEKKLLNLKNKVPKLVFTKLSDKNSWTEFIKLLNEKITLFKKNQELVNLFKSNTTFSYEGKLNNEVNYWFDDSKVKYTGSSDYKIEKGETRILNGESVLVSYRITNNETNYKFNVFVKYSYNDEDSSKDAEYINYKTFQGGILKSKHEEQLIHKIREEKVKKFMSDATFKYSGILNDEISGIFKRNKIIPIPLDGYDVTILNIKFEENKSVAVNFQVEFDEPGNNRHSFYLYVRFLHSNESNKEIVGTYITESEFNSNKYKNQKDYQYAKKLKINNFQSKISIKYNSTFTNMPGSKPDFRNGLKYEKRDEYQGYTIIPRSFKTSDSKKIFIIFFQLHNPASNESDVNIYIKFKYSDAKQEQLGMYTDEIEFKNLF
ncbi:hypothetical protein HGG64_01890 [Mycoplasma phocoeninasale]|uniref:Lipoprotein n=1 Tax=Mycoplasma phocoeninasale TaxID=2726117 RepID=A0A858U393_9MOLU|nr:hypothetical protein [Mycoplasma phocoeninasale]QJG66451.1 hypothetical protein HGG64_01890 [Mycoplasma phocoeninasale]